MAVRAGPVVVTDGLILYLDAANSASYTGISTWYDLSDYQYDATLGGSPSYSPVNAGVLDFNGSSQWVEVAKNDIHDNLGDSTFDFWLKFESLSDPIATALFTKRTDTANGIFIFVWSGNGGYISFDFGGSANRWITYVQPTLGIWSNLAFTKDSSARRMYTNGILTTSYYVPGADLSGMATPLVLAKSQAASYYLDGMIASFKMYNRALSDIEIRQNFETLRSRFGI